LFIKELLAWGHASEIIMYGSFVTSKPDPSDIDLLLFVEPGFDFDRLRPKVIYGFDLICLAADSPGRDGVIDHFRFDNKGENEKGLLRLRLSRMGRPFRRPARRMTFAGATR